MSHAPEQIKPAGLFHVAYEISAGMPGAATLRLDLVVYTPARSVHGSGEVSQPISPPLDTHSVVRGDYTSLPVGPEGGVFVTLTGYPDVKWPPYGGTGPVLMPDLHVRMTLDPTWQSGTASFDYLLPDGQWGHVDNVPVKAAVVTTL